MTDLVRYDLADGIATIVMDDGKANAFSPAMLAELHAALDQAQQDEAVVVLRGRPGMFSAGYDLKVFQSGDGDALLGMLREGGRLVARLLSFPRPVLAACTGHAMAQGLFTLTAADVRIGTAGDFRFAANEVAIGLAVPHYAVAACRHRMTAPGFDLALGTGMTVGPEVAREWGVLDVIVDPESFDAAVATEAARLANLVPEAHVETKSRVRGDLVATILAEIDREFPAP